jgi:hypothetical protein
MPSSGVLLYEDKRQKAICSKGISPLRQTAISKSFSTVPQARSSVNAFGIHGSSEYRFHSSSIRCQRYSTVCNVRLLTVAASSSRTAASYIGELTLPTLSGHSTQRIPDGKFRGADSTGGYNSLLESLGQFRSNCVFLPDRFAPDMSFRQALQELARQIAQRVAAYCLGIFSHQLELEKLALVEGVQSNCTFARGIGVAQSG